MTKYDYEEDCQFTPIRASSITPGSFFRLEGDLYKVLSHQKEDVLVLRMDILEHGYVLNNQCVTRVSVSVVETKVIL